MEDESIISLYLARDEAAITETDSKYGGFCRRLALNILSVFEDAEECVNDTYHAAWLKIPPELPQSLRAFLGRIVRNIAISRFRANTAQKRHSGMDIMLSELEDCIPDRDSVEAACDRARLTAVINAWLLSLPDGDRTLFVRRYWYGDTVGQLAKEAGCTPEKMAQRMFQLRRKLRAVLEKEDLM